MLCVQAGQEGVLGVLMLVLGSGLVCKQRKGIKASHRKHIPAAGIGGRACMDAELVWMLSLLLLSDFLGEVELGGSSCTSTFPKPLRIAV